MNKTSTGLSIINVFLPFGRGNSVWKGAKGERNALSRREVWYRDPMLIDENKAKRGEKGGGVACSNRRCLTFPIA